MSSRAVVTIEARFCRHGDRYWDPSGVFGLGFWNAYLRTFDEVVVVARVIHVQDADPASEPLAPSISFIELPDYHGPWGLLMKIHRLVMGTFEASRVDGSFILRVPAASGSLVWLWLRLLGKPYAVEVIGDPLESVRPANYFLAPVFSKALALVQRLQCRGAAAASYVTDRTLQHRYPAGGSTASFNVSDVMLGCNILDQPCNYAQAPRPFKMVYVAHFSAYKGHEYLIEALGRCREKGLEWHLTFIGEGDKRPHIESLARSLGIMELIDFRGTVSFGRDIFEALDNADMFVMPSLAEGLSRALIEAMARGLPIIATDVGGNSELLDLEDLVVPADAKALTDKIIECANDPKRLTRMSERNLLKARSFQGRDTDKRRDAFYHAVLELAGKNRK